MASVIKHTAVWTGVAGLPGYSQFYQEVTGSIPAQAQSAHNSVQAFFGALVALIPDAITVTVDPVYQVITVATGEVVAEDSVATPTSPVVGTYVSGWQHQVGILVEWLTGTFINGRRLRGRTYLVPLGNTADADGTLPGGTISVLASATPYVADGSQGFCVWHRPVAGVGGQVSTITSAVVRDKAAVLRSRMD